MKICKKHTKNRISIAKLVFICFSVIFCTSCSGDNDTAPDPTPSLSGISPTRGPKTTIVTINGSNFGTNTDAVTVFFNEVEAEVQSVGNDRITALVPPRAFTGIVKVVINGTDLTGPEFTYVITDILVSTIAGSTEGFADGTGANAQFSFPQEVAVDAQGNIYVADAWNHKIRKITPSGVVSTLAGSTEGFVNGTGANAQFFLPRGIDVDAQGKIYVGDTSNHSVRKITLDDVVSTLAGSTAGFKDGMGANAQFFQPSGIAVDAQGNIYVADTRNHKIRKITSDGEVSTLAGSIKGFGDDTGDKARFDSPVGIAVDAEGTLYVADAGNHRIRKITPDGTVSTLAGSTQGFEEGTGANAQFSSPHGVVVDTQGSIYVADTDNHIIRKITEDGMVSTLAGSTQGGFADGTGADAQFLLPSGIAVDAQGTMYVTDENNHKIRKIVQD